MFRFGISGIGSMVVHLLAYYLLLLFFDYKISNLIALAGAKITAFVLNKFWVFKSGASGKEAVWEIVKYVIARGLCTGCLDYFGLILCVDYFNCNEKIVKPFMLILVTLLNFVLGKFFVFTPKKEAGIEAK